MTLRPIHSVIALGTLWSAWFIVHTWFRHLNFFSSHFDLGIMEQVLWQTIHGHWFQMTSPTEGLIHFRAAIHADWLLLLYTPFYWLWHDPRILTTLQVLVVASGTVPLYFLARRQLSPRWSLSVVGLYLVQPTLQWSVIFDLHAVVLATPLILWGVWAAISRRWALMWLFFAASLLAKEEVGLVVALTAAVLGWRRHVTRPIAWTLGLVSLGWVILMTSFVIPTFAANRSHFAIEYFSEYGQTVPAIFLGLISHPVVFWHDLVNVTSFGYLLILFGSAAFLAWPRPLWIIPAAPIIVMNLISNDPNLRSPYYQYAATITPFVILASLDGLSTLLKLGQSRKIAIWTLGWVAVMVFLWAPLPGTRYHRNAIEVFENNPYRQIVHRLSTTIPPTIDLAVSNDLGPQFSRRNRVWVFPFALERAEAVIVLLNRPHDVRPQAELRETVNALLQNPEWRLVESSGNEFFYFARNKTAKISHFSSLLKKIPINMGI